MKLLILQLDLCHLLDLIAKKGNAANCVRDKALTTSERSSIMNLWN